MSLEFVDTPESDLSLEALQIELLKKAREAYQRERFDEGNAAMLHVVASQSACLTANAIGLRASDGTRHVLEGIFQDACTAQVQPFALCFNEEGQSMETEAARLIQASLQTGKVAAVHLVSAAQAVGMGDVQLEQFLPITSFDDALCLALDTLQRHGHIRSNERFNILTSIRSACMSNSVRDLLKSLLWEGDYLVKKVDQIPLESERSLSLHERKVLRIGTGLANAAWQMCQLNLAKWHRNPKMLTPQGTHHIFNPYDQLQIELYTLHSQREHGVIRVALEIWKDIRELKKHAFDGSGTSA